MADYQAMVHALYPEMVQLRRHLHQHPELSGEEHQTLAFILSHLDAWQIPYTRYANGGICAMIGQGEKAIGIRADMDALPIEEKTGLCYASQNPGVMHACGHDMHTAILLAAAKMFKMQEKELPCMVKLFFQPAEETVGGAKIMVDGGCMENPHVAQVLALHVDPALPVGTASFLPGKMNAAVIELDIKVKGKGCHGAHPEQGVDAIVAAAQIICALQTVNSRLSAPTDPVVLTIGILQGGTGRNIVAGEVLLQGTVRVLDMETAKNVKAHIIRMAESTAAAFGATAEVTLTDDYPALINHPALTRNLYQYAKEMLGEENVILLDTPSMGADDFAYFTQAAPGCYFNIGTGKKGEPAQSLHSGSFAPQEEAMETGLSLLSAFVRHLMEETP